MKHVFSKLAPMLVLIAALTFLVSGTASAQSTTATHQTITTAVAVALSCPATVQEGSTNVSVVKELQRALNGLYLDYSSPYYFENSPDNFKPPLTVDGGFGTLTRNAVIDFQTWNSPAYGGTLAVDGIVGPKTWHDLGKC